MMKTSDTRIANTHKIEAPESIIQSLPTNAAVDQLVLTTRQTASDILHARSDKLLVVVGPCSVHDPVAAVEYGEKLVSLRERFKGQLEVVMRVYFEKPRTTVGWKGLINDPDLDQSFNIDKGLKLARKLLLDLNLLGLPAASEFLDIVTGQYYADLISWGAIGARTTESQVHREMASGLSCPVGFKNGTEGNIQIALDAIRSSNHPHNFLSPSPTGQTAIYQTTGNQDTHLILRGGKTPNYEKMHVQACKAQLQKVKIETGLVVDFSHANSLKKYARQIIVGKNVAKQIAEGESIISGVMIESHLYEGRQDVVAGEPLRYGQSITDACIGWPETEILLESLAEAVEKRRRC